MGIEIELRTIVLDCKDAYELAYFYKNLLGWEFTYEEDSWVLMRNPSGGTGLSFQSESWYERPVWPEEKGKPTKMLHLDFKVSDTELIAAILGETKDITYIPKERIDMIKDFKILWKKQKTNKGGRC